MTATKGVRLAAASYWIAIASASGAVPTSKLASVQIGQCVLVVVGAVLSGIDITVANANDKRGAGMRARRGSLCRRAVGKKCLECKRIGRDKTDCAPPATSSTISEHRSNRPAGT